MIRALPLLLLSCPVLANPGAGANPPSLTSWLLSSLMVIGLILVLGFL
ncbi:TPA: flagellar biosynthetic protein FliO, partial [Aeromonas salmonicida]